jgi:hypothetical protein
MPCHPTPKVGVCRKVRSLFGLTIVYLLQLFGSGLLSSFDSPYQKSILLIRQKKRLFPKILISPAAFRFHETEFGSSEIE